MTPHRFSQPLCAQPHAQIEANSPALQGSVASGLFIPSQCAPSCARDGGGVPSSHGPAVTYSPAVGNAARRASGARKDQVAKAQADQIKCFSNAARFCRVAAEAA